MSRTTRSAIGAMHPTVFSFVAFAIAAAMAVFIGNAVQASLNNPSDVAFEKVPKPSSAHLLADAKSAPVFR